MAGKTGSENVSKEEQIGFHKGALATLIKEREEMGKILGIIEQLVQMHVKSLEGLGVSLKQQKPVAKLDDKLRQR